MTNCCKKFLDINCCKCDKCSGNTKKKMAGPRRLDGRPAVVCPGGCMWLQGFEPKSCSLGTPGRSYFCGTFFVCDKCHRAYKTCKELKKHKEKEISKSNFGNNNNYNICRKRIC